MMDMIAVMEVHSVLLHFQKLQIFLILKFKSLKDGNKLLIHKYLKLLIHKYLKLVNKQDLLHELKEGIYNRMIV